MSTKIEWTDAILNHVSGCTKNAGHLLDGREHHEFPNTKEAEHE